MCGQGKYTTNTTNIHELEQYITTAAETATPKMWGINRLKSVVM
jgi:hypothetical protein